MKRVWLIALKRTARLQFWQEIYPAALNSGIFVEFFVFLRLHHIFALPIFKAKIYVRHRGYCRKAV